MEDLLLNSFIFFLVAGMVMPLMFSTPKAPNKPQGKYVNNPMMPNPWNSTKEGKKYNRAVDFQWKLAKYWLYIMLAHGAIFFIMLISS